MELHKLLGAATVAALLAGCSGGGGSSSVTPSTPNAPSAPTAPQNGPRGTLSIRVDASALHNSAKARSPKQISTGTDTVDIVVDGTDNTIALSTCPSNVCTIAVAAATHTVSVKVLQSNTPLGVSASQSLTVTAGNVTPATFTITPIVNSIGVMSDAVRLPEDSTARTANITVNALDPLGNAITSPIDTSLFGTVSLASDYGTVSAASATASGGAFSYPATTLSYDGGVPTNHTITLTGSYANANAVTFPGTAGTATIYTSNLAYSTPSDSQFNGTGTLTFSTFGTYTGLTLKQTNAGAKADGSTATSNIAFAAGSTACNERDGHAGSWNSDRVRPGYHAEVRHHRRLGRDDLLRHVLYDGLGGG